MKKSLILISVLLLLFITAQTDCPAAQAVSFPEITDFKKYGEPASYDPQTLYEYINGAAESYNQYGFEELTVLSYDRDDGASITVEIYRHLDPNHGFGIYCQERPTTGNFVTIGAEGYTDTGILNYFKGSHYVKVSGFQLGDQGDKLLEDLGQKIAAQLDGPEGMPSPTQCFPKEDKIAHSERFIARDFLGHQFLHAAFVAEYETEGKSFKGFILEGADDKDAEGMVSGYLALLKKKEVSYLTEDGVYRFTDPYARSYGPVTLKRQGRFIWGLFHEDKLPAGIFIVLVEEALRGKGLLD